MGLVDQHVDPALQLRDLEEGSQAPSLARAMSLDDRKIRRNADAQASTSMDVSRPLRHFSSAKALLGPPGVPPAAATSSSNHAPSRSNSSTYPPQSTGPRAPRPPPRPPLMQMFTTAPIMCRASKCEKLFTNVEVMERHFREAHRYEGVKAAPMPVKTTMMDSAAVAPDPSTSATNASSFVQVPVESWEARRAASLALLQDLSAPESGSRRPPASRQPKPSDPEPPQTPPKPRAGHPRASPHHIRPIPTRDLEDSARNGQLGNTPAAPPPSPSSLGGKVNEGEERPASSSAPATSSTYTTTDAAAMVATGNPPDPSIYGDDLNKERFVRLNGKIVKVPLGWPFGLKSGQPPPPSVQAQLLAKIQLGQLYAVDSSHSYAKPRRDKVATYAEAAVPSDPRNELNDSKAGSGHPRNRQVAVVSGAEMLKQVAEEALLAEHGVGSGAERKRKGIPPPPARVPKDSATTQNVHVPQGALPPREGSSRPHMLVPLPGSGWNIPKRMLVADYSDPGMMPAKVAEGVGRAHGREPRAQVANPSSSSGRTFKPPHAAEMTSSGQQKRRSSEGTVVGREVPVRQVSPAPSGNDMFSPRIRPWYRDYSDPGIQKGGGASGLQPLHPHARESSPSDPKVKEGGGGIFGSRPTVVGHFRRKSLRYDSEPVMDRSTWEVKRKSDSSLLRWKRDGREVDMVIDHGPAAASAAARAAKAEGGSFSMFGIGRSFSPRSARASVGADPRSWSASRDYPGFRTHSFGKEESRAAGSMTPKSFLAAMRGKVSSPMRSKSRERRRSTSQVDWEVGTGGTSARALALQHGGGLCLFSLGKARQLLDSPPPAKRRGPVADDWPDIPGFEDDKDADMEKSSWERGYGTDNGAFRGEGSGEDMSCTSGPEMSPGPWRGIGSKLVHALSSTAKKNGELASSLKIKGTEELRSSWDGGPWSSRPSTSGGVSELTPPREITFPCDVSNCPGHFCTAEELEMHRRIYHSVVPLWMNDGSKNVKTMPHGMIGGLSQGPGASSNRIGAFESALDIRSTPQSIENFENYRLQVVENANNSSMKFWKSPNLALMKCRQDGNQVQRFYGTSLACHLGINNMERLCNSEKCGLCCILRSGFTFKTEGSARYGWGIHTASTVFRAHQNRLRTEGESRVTKRAVILVCQVIAGRVCQLPNAQIVGPPPGFDSVELLNEEDSEPCDDLIVFEKRAILPLFALIYRSV